MKRHRFLKRYGLQKRIIAFFIMLVMMSSCLSQFCVCDAAAETSAWDIAADMNPGWSLGNSLEYQNVQLGFMPSINTVTPDFTELEMKTGNPVTTEELIKAVADSGFKSIRICVSFYNHLEESKPAEGEEPNKIYHAGTTIDPRWLKRIKEVVDWSLGAGLYVIINDHHDTGMYKDKKWIFADKGTIDEQINNFTKIWEQYAECFKDYDHKLIFQSLGEVVNPERSFDSKDYEDFQMAHDLNQAFINTIRETGGKNADRILILPTYASSAEPIFIDQNFYKPFKDSAKDKLMFSIHNYSTDQEYLEWSFNHLYKKAVRYGMPYIMTECGTKLEIGEDRRAEVSAKLVEQAQKYGMAAIIWDDGLFRPDGMGIVDREASMATGELKYKSGCEKIVPAMMEAKRTTQRLPDKELTEEAIEEYHVSDFTPLDDAHTDQLRKGMYSTINAGAANPMSVYMSIPSNYASVCPYVAAKSFDRITATLPDTLRITIREIDKDGRYIRDGYISETGKSYKPSDEAEMIGITIRPINTNDEELATKLAALTLGDYKKYIQKGDLKIEADNYHPKTEYASLTTLSEEVQGKLVLSWSEDESASGFRIIRKKTGSDEWEKICEMTKEEAKAASYSYTDETALPNTDYRYTVIPYLKTKDNVYIVGKYDENGLEITTKEKSEIGGGTENTDNTGSTETEAERAERERLEKEKAEELEWNGTLNKKIPPVKRLRAKSSKQSVKISWKKASKKNLKKFDRLEIQVCTDKKFKKGNTKRIEVKKSKKSYAVKGLKKGKRYFVRARNVKGRGTAKQVSKWSKIRAVKIKK